jgi:hypothetical protein
MAQVRDGDSSSRAATAQAPALSRRSSSARNSPASPGTTTDEAEQQLRAGVLQRREPDLISMLPAGHDAAEALYPITDATYKRRSLAVTSNIQLRMHRPALADGGRQIVPSVPDLAADTDGQQARISAGPVR